MRLSGLLRSSLPSDEKPPKNDSLSMDRGRGFYTFLHSKDIVVVLTSVISDFHRSEYDLLSDHRQHNPMGGGQRPCVTSLTSLTPEIPVHGDSDSCI